MPKANKTSVKKINKKATPKTEKSIVPENKFNIFAKYKAKESEIKSFDFKIEKQKLITIPEGESAR